MVYERISKMNRLLFPNGHHSFEIIYKLAKEEFGDSIGECKDYLSLNKKIVSALKKMNKQELEDNRLKTLVNIEHYKVNDFAGYMSVKFTYWSLIIATLLTIFNDNVYKYFNVNEIDLFKIVTILFTIFLIVMSRTIHIQHDKLEYYNFKLICFEELENRRKA